MPKRQRENLRRAAVVSAVCAFVFIGCNRPQSTSAAPAATDAPAGYVVEVSTDSGKSMVTSKSKVSTVDAALLATLPDLAAYFDAKPTIGSAYQDAHDSTVGGATFSDTLHGQQIRGILSCKLHDGGATVDVIFCNTNAPKADLEKLMSAPKSAAPAPAAPAAPVAPAAPPVPLTEQDFPDGTGSISLADGWTTQTQSAADPIFIVGPAGQTVILHNGIGVNTSDSPIVRQRQALLNMEAQNARYGFNIKPPKLVPLIVAPFTDPVSAIQNLMPAISQRTQFYGGPSMTFDHIISSKTLPTKIPDAKSAYVDYVFTKTAPDGTSTSCRSEAVLTSMPVPYTPTAWLLYTPIAVQSPVGSFKQDLPVMAAMAKSAKINMDRLIQVMQARNRQTQQMSQQLAAAADAQRKASADAFNQWQQTSMDIHNQQMAESDREADDRNQNFNNYEWQRSRNAADFNESIIGTRTVYDTVTGESGYANLTDVNGVVDSLNDAANDPNRFVQVPLRDQLYPVPPGK